MEDASPTSDPTREDDPPGGRRQPVSTAAVVSKSRLLVVSNRLPVRRVRREGHSEWIRSSGGLVSALVPALQGKGGSWFGWSGTKGKGPQPFEHDGIGYGTVPLSSAEIESYYDGFSNRTLWPLYHDQVRTPEFHRSWWRSYQEVNQRFAEVATDALGPDDVAWVQDYHLQLVPRFMRGRRPRCRIGFFLHIPFPPVELFGHLPWRRELLEGLLGSDVIGFQTRGGAQNFLSCVSRFTTAQVNGDTVQHEGRTVRVGAFPISIDFDHYDAAARSDEVQAKIGRLLKRMGGRRIFLGIDRLDYTKGIDKRLKAFEGLLRRRENAARELAFIQIAVPSREDVGEYADMRGDIEQLVGRINGQYGEAGTTPIHYLYRSVSALDLSAYYAAADVMVVTPLRDGMNLVAKEYVASRTNGDGALVLSEFTGAARELRTALLVNPYDVDGTIASLEDALDMPLEEVGRRMRVLRRIVQSNNVHHWSASFLSELTA
jgi:trehalose 6-phosphate synthase